MIPDWVHKHAVVEDAKRQHKYVVIVRHRDDLATATTFLRAGRHLELTEELKTWMAKQAPDSQWAYVRNSDSDKDTGYFMIFTFSDEMDVVHFKLRWY